MENRFQMIYIFSILIYINQELIYHLYIF